MRTRNRATVLATIVLALASAGCAGQAGASNSPGVREEVMPNTSAPNDPALDHAANEVDGLLKSKYAQWYAGKVLENPGRTMIIYRKPGSDLDQAVRELVSGVQVRFADALLSEREMLDLTERVMADATYWREQGVSVTGAGPLPDGSAVRVMTATGAPEEGERLSRHYQQPIVASRASVTFALGY
ncbi:hypothetical protein BDK92_1719 [Micromonospora pisi]|uniref:Uncharacterized protein n=1 Tax=Micromonospora pisi TaxID=589240 RepID=A0A495JF06_9ACTN|nr:hypothetical protein [Micromonospora pisi]RKR87443.1 hypothetical protein BDK92_1719 [Micromonospora pisi]